MLLTLAVRGIIAAKSERFERFRSRLQRNDLVENSYPHPGHDLLKRLAK
jgi:hypothetical protein